MDSAFDPRASGMGALSDFSAYRRAMELAQRGWPAQRHGRPDIVVEVGAGHQFFTALFFLSAGAAKVILVDPKVSKTLGNLEDTIKVFENSVGREILPQAGPAGKG